MKSESLIEINVKEQKWFGSLAFPLALSPPENVRTINEVVDYVVQNRTNLLEHLVKHGAILFRGFPINNASDFNEFATSFGWRSLPYLGGIAPRTHIVGSVFTSNEGPPDFPIPFHHEMSYLPKSPSTIMFYCDVPPAKGGETPICLSNLVYEQMCKEFPEFVQELKEKGVKYTMITPDGDDKTSAVGRGWQSKYGTSDRNEAERKIRDDLGGEAIWMPDGCLKYVSKVLKAIRFDDRVGLYTWFNVIVGAYYGWRDSRNEASKVVMFGDGTPIKHEIIERCQEILYENCVSFKWEKGDVIVIDNMLAMHSRNLFEPPRRILAALFE